MAPKRKDRPRKQLNIRVPVETKERLIRCAAYYGFSITSLLERSAEEWEKRTLARLSEPQRPLYLSGRLTFGEAFKRSHSPEKAPRAKGPQAVSVAVLSALLNADASAQLHRFADFYELALADVVDRFSNRLEQGALRQLDPEHHQDFLAGKFDRFALVSAEAGADSIADEA